VGHPERSEQFHGAPQQHAQILGVSAFSIGRNQLPYAMLALIAGDNIRVGLEDNLWLKRGVLATNKDLVEQAVTIARAANARILGPSEVRRKLNLSKRW
jgi:uncharacterized protein (DUF849 family)